MCNFIQRPWHSCESHAWDTMNLTPARVTQLWIGRSHYARSPDGSSSPGLLWCQLSGHWGGPRAHGPLPAPTIAPLSMEHNYPVPGCEARKEHPGCEWLRAGQHWGSQGTGEQGTGETGGSSAAFPFGKPQPSAWDMPCAPELKWAPSKSVSIISSGVLCSTASTPVGGHAAAQLGIMPLLPGWASSMANACCKKPAGQS